MQKSETVGAKRRLGVRGVVLSTRVRRVALSLALFVALVGTWEGLAQAGVVNRTAASSPSQIAATFVSEVRTGRLQRHFAPSAAEFALGFTLAAVTAVPAGLLLGASRRLEWAFNPYILGMYATPSQAWLPLLIVWLGIGLSSKVALVFLFAFFVICLNTISGVKSLDPRLVEVARAFGCTRRQIFTKVALPFALPYIVAGLRLGVGRAVIGVFLAEMFGANEGIGFYILRSGTEYRVDRVFVGVLTLVVASVAVTEALRYVEGRLGAWRTRTRL
jgi:NitT/TauT family transport system permease protein